MSETTCPLCQRPRMCGANRCVSNALLGGALAGGGVGLVIAG